MLEEAHQVLESRILVVDDSPQNTKLLRLILKDAGYQVTEASSGPEALEKLKSDKPDAMILDVRMPGMSGYEVCRQVRADPEFSMLPVIMLTALMQTSDRIQGIEAGATAFISKPFNKRELIATVQSSLAMAQTAKSAIIPQLPGAVIITSPSWKILGASTAAAALLGTPSGTLSGLDLLMFLKYRGVELPGVELTENDPLTFDQPWTFQTAGTAATESLLGLHTPVKNPEGTLVLRAIILTKPSQ